MSGGTQSRGRMSMATWSRRSCTSAGARRCRCPLLHQVSADKCACMAPPLRGNACFQRVFTRARLRRTCAGLSLAAVPRNAAQLPALPLHPGLVVDFRRRDAARGAHVLWACGGVSSPFVARHAVMLPTIALARASVYTRPSARAIVQRKALAQACACRCSQHAIAALVCVLAQR